MLFRGRKRFSGNYWIARTARQLRFGHFLRLRRIFASAAEGETGNYLEETCAAYFANLPQWKALPTERENQENIPPSLLARQQAFFSHDEGGQI